MFQRETPLDHRTSVDLILSRDLPVHYRRRSQNKVGLSVKYPEAQPDGYVFSWEGVAT